MFLNPGLGSLSILPYEVRELIWLEFFSALKKKEITRTDLMITRVSKAICEEVSEVIYSHSYLRFDLERDFHRPQWALTIRGKVEFIRRFRGHEEVLGEWIWHDHDWRLDNFPMHRLRAVEVSLTAPYPEHPDQVLWLWRNVVKTAELLIEGRFISHLTILLQKDTTSDWCNPNWSDHSMFERYDKRIYELIVRPLYLLRNVENIELIPHSDTLKREMDWKEIHWAERVVTRRTADPTNPNTQNDERRLQNKAADDLNWVECALSCPFLSERPTFRFMFKEADKLDYVYVFRQKLGVKEQDDRDPRSILFNGWRRDEHGWDVMKTFKGINEEGRNPSQMFMDGFPDPYDLKPEARELAFGRDCEAALALVVDRLVFN